MDLEGSDHDLIELLSPNLPEEPEEESEKRVNASWYRRRDSNQAPPEHKSRALPEGPLKDLNELCIFIFGILADFNEN
jgi:hypothetical protein